MEDKKRRGFVKKRAVQFFGGVYIPGDDTTPPCLSRMNAKMQQIDARARIQNHADIPVAPVAQGRMAKSNGDSNELEVTVWVLIGVLLALIFLFGCLLWTKV